MAVIVKCPPVDLSTAQQFMAFSKPYGGVEPVAGDVAYVWFSESKGGNGLARRGRIVAVGDEKPLPLLIIVDTAIVLERLDRSDLAPFRDSNDGSPLAGLSRKLYRDSLDKVAELTEIEVEFLEQRFGLPGKALIPTLDSITEAELTAMENVRGDGRRMFADIDLYRLTTTAENPDADSQRKPGTIRGTAADFIARAGGTVHGRVLHFHMLKQSHVGKWDHGYVHARSALGNPKRGASRDWLRRV